MNIILRVVYKKFRKYFFLCKIKRSLGNIMAFVISLLSGVQVTFLFFSNLTCVMSDLKEEGFMINYSDTLPSPPAVFS